MTAAGGVYELYLIRHGVAEDRGDAWPDDSARPLTAEGTERLVRSADGLHHLGVRFDEVLSSPFVRARQTADVVAATLAERRQVVLVDSLAPGGTFQGLLADLEAHRRRTRMALVGHQPWLGEIAARLLGTRHPVPFKKGAVCRIDVNALPPTGAGDLVWFLPPKVLRQLSA